MINNIMKMLGTLAIAVMSMTTVCGMTVPQMIEEGNYTGIRELIFSPANKPGVQQIYKHGAEHFGNVSKDQYKESNRTDWTFIKDYDVQQIFALVVNCINNNDIRVFSNFKYSKTGHQLKFDIQTGAIKKLSAPGVWNWSGGKNNAHVTYLGASEKTHIAGYINFLHDDRTIQVGNRPSESGTIFFEVSKK